MEKARHETFFSILPKWLGRLVSVINIFLAAGLIYLFASRNIYHPSEGWNWTDFVTILLGVATIVLAALGSLIAVAALWGYQQIQKGAESRSVKAVDRYLHSEEFERQLGDIINEQLEKRGALKAVEEGIATPTDQEPQGSEKDWSD